MVDVIIINISLGGFFNIFLICLPITARPVGVLPTVVCGVVPTAVRAVPPSWVSFSYVG